MDSITWEKSAKENFDAVLDKIPVFLRSIAAKKVADKAASLALADNRREVALKDVVDAFFIETPFGFHGPMKTDMESLGIDYKQYGH